MPSFRIPRKLLLLTAALLISSLAFLLLAPRLPSSNELLDVVNRQSSHRTSFFPPRPDLCAGHDPRIEDGDFCAHFPKDLLNDIQIVVKTGIGERNKLEALLDTFGSCIDNILIMSDVADTVRGHRVHDVLAELPKSYAEDNPDWKAYKTQRAAFASGKTVDKSAEGWKLDRFKFLPMIEKAFQLHPNAKWYVFIETDTYHFWDTLFRVLGGMDPTKRHYMGTAVPAADNVWFAYGGAGFVLSGALVQDMNLGRTEEGKMSSKYSDLVKGDCCGDTSLAYSLYREFEVRVQNLHPTFSGDEPPWLEVDRPRRCVPLLALHRVQPEKMRELWRWERCRRESKHPLTYLDMLEFNLAPVIGSAGSVRTYWDNGANFAQPEHNSTAEACFRACEASDSCLQATWFENVCQHAAFARPGSKVENAMRSMWNMKNLEKLGWRPGLVNTRTCDTWWVDWPKPRISP